MTITFTGQILKSGNARREEIRIGGQQVLLTNRAFRFLFRMVLFCHEESPVEWQKFRLIYSDFNNSLAQLRHQLREAEVEQDVIRSYGGKSGLYELACDLHEVKMNVDQLLQTLDEDLKIELQKLMERKVLK